MYGLSSSTPGTVYQINTATGAATSVVNLTGDSTTSLVDISFLNGTLYASDVFAGRAFTFGTINLTTGAYTAINNQGGSANWQGLAAIPSKNLLYAVALDSLGDPLVSVTPGGVVSTIGPTNRGIEDLAYDGIHGILYGVDVSSLFTIDPLTGNTTLIGALGISGGRPGLGYDANNNTLYLNEGGTGNFYSVNSATGQATLIGSNGSVNGQGIDGLADLPASSVPEPQAVLLLLSVVAIIRPWRWNKAS